MAIGSVGMAFAVWSFQAWYGSILVARMGACRGDAFNSGVCIIMGGLAVGASLVNVGYFAEAKVVAYTMSEMIERVPTIDPNDNGKIMTKFEGEIEFKDVDLCYSSRLENIVLGRFNLHTVADQIVGLVGGSGSGKSTLISLIEWFYELNKGEIVLDGIRHETYQMK